MSLQIRPHRYQKQICLQMTPLVQMVILKTIHNHHPQNLNLKVTQHGPVDQLETVSPQIISVNESTQLKRGKCNNLTYLEHLP